MTREGAGSSGGVVMVSDEDVWGRAGSNFHNPAVQIDLNICTSQIGRKCEIELAKCSPVSLRFELLISLK